MLPLAVVLQVTNLPAQSVSSQSQTIQLDAGTTLTFIGLTHGSHHIAPHYEHLATGNWIYTSNGATVAWIEAKHDTGGIPSYQTYQLLISDRANSGCVSTELRTSSHVKPGLEVQGFVLNAFPRWEKETILRVRPYRGTIVQGQFVISNAEYQSGVSWPPEALPETKSDGDLEVTLTNLMPGVPVPHWIGRPAPDDDPVNRCVRIAFGFRQNGQSATNWRPWLALTTDPAGNYAEGVISDYPDNGVYTYPRGNPPFFKTDGYFYQPGLWPGESPWKVRLEFTRTSGFGDDEILSLTNLPVRAGTKRDGDDEWTWDPGKTNFAFTAATVNGVPVKVLVPLLLPDEHQAGQKRISVVIYADPNPKLQDMHLALLQATDDQGRVISTPFQPASTPYHRTWAVRFSLDFPYAPDTKTLTLRLALQKSRFVEFTVNPAKL